MIRTIAESVESWEFKARTWTSFALRSFTTSSSAPTLFCRKIENCLTVGPEVFSVTLGTSVGMKLARRFHLYE